MKLPQELASFEIDHIGIAVDNIHKAFVFYKHLGFCEMAIEEVAGEKVRVGMLELKNSARIELLEPTADDSPIKKFLAKRGPGLHHICLRVNDLAGLLQKLKGANIELINDQPKQGAHECLVAFVHPRATGGILLELSQKVGS
jgi:methylmalonyl-CoA epimerase